jgi:hypothetical protein
VLALLFSLLSLLLLPGGKRKIGRRFTFFLALSVINLL